MKKQLLSLLIAGAVSATAIHGAEAPKYIFYFIGDGMGMGHVMAAEAYNRMVLGSTDPILMMQFPVASQATTYSASSPVTDSAAAGTALATGHKTNNGMLGVTPDSAAVTSIARTLFDDGYGIGLVTSVPPDDATPGAFYAHVPSRSMYYEIGKDAAASGYDFIAGSNLRGLVDKQGQPTDLLDIMAENSVRIVRGTEGLDTITSRRVILLGPDPAASHIGYTIDSVAGALTLPAMTQACIDHLLKNGRDRFFMMVEGGNIDWSAHVNDGGTVIKEVLNFNQSLRLAYDFYLAHPDETLIVVTADHETGGLGLGNNNLGYNMKLHYFDFQKVSKDQFSTYCNNLLRSRRIYTWEDMHEYLSDNLGFWSHVPITDAQTQELKEDFEKCFVRREGKDEQTLYSTSSEFVVKVFRILDSVTGIGWTTNNHTGGLVPVYACGVGAQKFSPMTDNTQIPVKILQIAQGNY